MCVSVSICMRNRMRAHVVSCATVCMSVRMYIRTCMMYNVCAVYIIHFMMGIINTYSIPSLPSPLSLSPLPPHLSAYSPRSFGTRTTQISANRLPDVG